MVQAAHITNELIMKKDVPLKLELFVEPVTSPDSIDWCEWKKAVKDTLVYLRERAKQLNEPREITLKKMEAVRNHTPTNGSIAICNLGTEDSPILKGIPVRKKLTSE